MIVEPHFAAFAIEDEDVAHHPEVNDGNASFRSYVERHGITSRLYMDHDEELLFPRGHRRPG